MIEPSSAASADTEDLCAINSGDFAVEYGCGGPDPAEVIEQLSHIDLTTDARAWLLAEGVPEAMTGWVVECRSGYVMCRRRTGSDDRLGRRVSLGLRHEQLWRAGL
jgi:hypothetical protein